MPNSQSTIKDQSCEWIPAPDPQSITEQPPFIFTPFPTKTPDGKPGYLLSEYAQKCLHDHCLQPLIGTLYAQYGAMTANTILIRILSGEPIDNATLALDEDNLAIPSLQRYLDPQVINDLHLHDPDAKTPRALTPSIGAVFEFVQQIYESYIRHHDQTVEHLAKQQLADPNAYHLLLGQLNSGQQVLAAELSEADNAAINFIINYLYPEVVISTPGSLQSYIEDQDTFFLPRRYQLLAALSLEAATNLYTAVANVTTKSSSAAALGTTLDAICIAEAETHAEVDKCDALGSTLPALKRLQYGLALRICIIQLSAPKYSNDDKCQQLQDLLNCISHTKIGADLTTADWLQLEREMRMSKHEPSQVLSHIGVVPDEAASTDLLATICQQPHLFWVIVHNRWRVSSSGNTYFEHTNHTMHQQLVTNHTILQQIVPDAATILTIVNEYPELLDELEWVLCTVHPEHVQAIIQHAGGLNAVLSRSKRNLFRILPASIIPALLHADYVLHPTAVLERLSLQQQHNAARDDHMLRAMMPGPVQWAFVSVRDPQLANNHPTMTNYANYFDKFAANTQTRLQALYLATDTDDVADDDDSNNVERIVKPIRDLASILTDNKQEHWAELIQILGKRFVNRVTGMDHTEDPWLLAHFFQRFVPAAWSQLLLSFDLTEHGTTVAHCLRFLAPVPPDKLLFACSVDQQRQVVCGHAELDAVLKCLTPHQQEQLFANLGAQHITKLLRAATVHALVKLTNSIHAVILAKFYREYFADCNLMAKILPLPLDSRCAILVRLLRKFAEIDRATTQNTDPAASLAAEVQLDVLKLFKTSDILELAEQPEMFCYLGGCLVTRAREYFLEQLNADTMHSMLRAPALNIGLLIYILAIVPPARHPDVIATVTETKIIRALLEHFSNNPTATPEIMLDSLLNNSEHILSPYAYSSSASRNNVRAAWIKVTAYMPSPAAIHEETTRLQSLRRMHLAPGAAGTAPAATTQHEQPGGSPTLRH